MLLIVGLGNPGEKYQYSRHNIGFMVVNQVVKDMVNVDKKTWQYQDKCRADLYKTGDLVFTKPTTYMNAAGFAVAKLKNFYHIQVEQIWVVHDDIDLPLGKIRIRQGGASAGHHGIESIIQQLGSDRFVRFRLGVGRGKLDKKKHFDQALKRHMVEKYVISRFSFQEESQVRKMIKHAAKAIAIGLHQGLDRVMNLYN